MSTSPAPQWTTLMPVSGKVPLASLGLARFLESKLFKVLYRGDIESFIDIIQHEE